MNNSGDPEAIRWQASDGTWLYACQNKIEQSGLAPLLCLPGLMRNGKDFAPLFQQFGHQRRIIAMDFRGRGKSAFALNPASYRPDVELSDTIGLLDHLNIDRVAVVGTSRGGIVGMLMAALNPNRIAGLFLNDVGATLEIDGLLRISSYVGTSRAMASWAEAVDILKATNIGFERVSDAEWLNFAKRVMVWRNNRLYADYDPALAITFPKRDEILAGTVSNLWPLMPNLIALPFAVLRGANSDLLQHETVLAMAKQIPEMLHAEVPDRGHSPFLDEARSKELLSFWCLALDAKEKGR